MARMLGRSKSLRLLKGSQKEPHQQDSGASPLQDSNFQAETQKLKAASPTAPSERWVETPDMLQRPKTSSGSPAERAKQFHKKVSPATLSAQQQPASEFLSPSPTTTVLYATEVHEDGVIGIALGSPSMATPWTQSPPPNDFVTRNTGTVTEISSHRSFTDSIESRQEAPKPKISRWKSLFKKSPSIPQQPEKPFYQLQQSNPPVRADSHHEEESQEWSIPAKQETRSASPATFNPDIRKSRKVTEFSYPALAEKPRARTEAESVTGRPKASLARAVSSPRPAGKNSPKYSPIVPKVVVSDGSQNTSPRPLGEKPLLDVDIPTIQMERYSVMFGSLLQSNNGPSSLLARRQGNTDKLKPLNELSTKMEGNAPQHGILKPPQRRATSPSFSKSPTVSLSLFPPPGGQREGKTPSPRMSSVHRARPLRRSRTAPAISPNRESFGASSREDPELSNEQRASEDESHSLRIQELTPTPSTRRSFDSDSQEVPIVIARAPSPWKPRMKEPEWEIVSKPSADPVSQTPPASAASQSRAEFQVSSSPRAAEQAAQSKSATTVGVARQVSVSRAGSARRNLLKPIVRTDSVEKLVDKKPLTPTLVELKNRKSQRVQLVDF